MSTQPPKNAEQKRATAVIELAKEFIAPAILAQGQLSATALPADVSAYFDRTCNIAFSLAGLFRRKSIEVLESARKMDEKADSDAG